MAETVSDAARHWYFTNRPVGDLDDNTLTLKDEALPALSDGELLVRTIYISMDATNRLWLSEWDLYMDTIPLGERMQGFAIGEVMDSKNPAYPKGALVTGLFPWADRFVTTGEGFQVFPDIPGLDLAEAFGILAVAGPTAIHGLLKVGRPEPGQTVLVTAAAGAVGQLVGQIAKIHGCRVIGVAGGDDKCRMLTELYGYDAAVDYKKGDLVEQLRTVAPEGIDCLFENVGGDVLDAGLTVMNDFGSVVICGLISSYNSADPVPGPYMFRNLIMRRLRVEGFVILDHMDAFPEYQAQMIEWMLQGKLKYRLHVVDGLENCLNALKLLYTGGNGGKVMAKVGAEPGEGEG